MKKISVFLFALVFIGQLTAQNWWKSSVKGSGPIVEKELKVAPFDGVNLQFSGDVYLKQGPNQSIQVEGQQNIIDLISTKVEDKVWKIRFTQNVRNSQRLKIYITVPSLKSATISGSGDMMTSSKFEGLETLALRIAGSGDLSFETDAASIESKITGSGDLDIKGTTEQLGLQVTGSGDVDAYNLMANNCEVRVMGSGNAKVNVKDNLEVRVTGSGDVLYKGNPNVVSKISGSGDLVSRP